MIARGSLYTCTFRPADAGFETVHCLYMPVPKMQKQAIA